MKKTAFIQPMVTWEMTILLFQKNNSNLYQHKIMQNKIA